MFSISASSAWRGGVAIQIEDHGTLIVIRPLDEPTRQWVAENVCLEDYMRIGNAFACERRYAGSILEGIRDAGLSG